MDGQWAIVDRAAAVQVGREHGTVCVTPVAGSVRLRQSRTGGRAHEVRDALESRMQRRGWGVHAARVSWNHKVKGG